MTIQCRYAKCSHLTDTQQTLLGYFNPTTNQLKTIYSQITGELHHASVKSKTKTWNRNRKVCLSYASWHRGPCLAAASECKFFTVDVNVPLKELGHPYRKTSAQTHHSRDTIPSCCIIAPLWPNYFHHARTITARSNCLELNKRSWGSFYACNPFWMWWRSHGMQTLKKSMTLPSVFGNRIDQFSPV